MTSALLACSPPRAPPSANLAPLESSRIRKDLVVVKSAQPDSSLIAKVSGLIKILIMVGPVTLRKTLGGEAKNRG